jgi:putative thiamine transport system substrate-binding protein
VLSIALLPEKDKALFDHIDLGPATLRPEALGTPIPEPHPSWMTAIEAAWAKRYAAQ